MDSKTSLFQIKYDVKALAISPTKDAVLVGGRERKTLPSFSEYI